MLAFAWVAPHLLVRGRGGWAQLHPDFPMEKTWPQQQGIVLCALSSKGNWRKSYVHLATYMLSRSCCSIGATDISSNLLQTTGLIIPLCTQQSVFDHSRTCLLPHIMFKKAIQPSCDTTKGERTYHFPWSCVLLVNHLCSYNCMPYF